MTDDGGRLRPLTPADAGALAAIDEALFGPGAWTRAMIAEELTAPARHYAGIDTDGGLVGYAGIALAETSQIMTIGVLTGHQGRGWGARLLTDLIDAARAARSRDVILEVRANAPVPQRLYRRFGFTPIGVRPRYYRPEGVDAIVMRLPLRSSPGPIGSEVVDA
ncbi:ribosomal protein S18-alanine N-acetyltransferase [Pseudactinotalea sp. HY160]|uniref:ribosomal protein S18-alanine N-acetyltransferase n=1 Tax=Pseudactinotalea sp. HY160 TaxID=2654490 RepID=UPI00351BE979